MKKFCASAVNSNRSQCHPHDKKVLSMITFFENTKPNRTDLWKYTDDLADLGGDELREEAQKTVSRAYYRNMHTMGLDSTNVGDILTPIVKKDVKRILGAGVNGLVLEIEEHGKRMAMKLMRPAEDGDDWGKREIYAQKKFHAVGLGPDVADGGMLTWGGREYLFIIMEMVDHTLYDLLCAGIIPPRELASSVVSVLLRMEAARVTHGDMHPFNIGFRARGGMLEPVLIDFGWSDWTHARSDLDIDQFIGVLESHMYPHWGEFRDVIQGSFNDHTFHPETYEDRVRGAYNTKQVGGMKTDPGFLRFLSDIRENESYVPQGVGLPNVGTLDELRMVEDVHVPYEVRDGRLITYAGKSMSVPYNATAAASDPGKINGRVNAYDVLARIKRVGSTDQYRDEQKEILKLVLNGVGPPIPPSMCYAVRDFDGFDQYDCDAALNSLLAMKESSERAAPEITPFMYERVNATDYVHYQGGLQPYRVPMYENVFYPVFWAKTSPFVCPRTLDPGMVSGFDSFHGSSGRGVTNEMVGREVEHVLSKHGLGRVVPLDELSAALELNMRNNDDSYAIADAQNGWVVALYNVGTYSFSVVWITASGGSPPQLGLTPEEVDMYRVQPTNPAPHAPPHTATLFMLTFLLNATTMGSEALRSAVCDRMIAMPTQYVWAWLYFIGWRSANRVVE